MSKILIVADDLTGANATGALLRKKGYSTYTAIGRADQTKNASSADKVSSKETFKTFDCIVCPTDSRGISCEEAYKRVYDAVLLHNNEALCLYSKRIDSTLRGNVGSETDAFLEALGDPKRIAIAASCFPESGRIISGGYMLVNGVPLHKTGAAVDPKTPVNTSNIADVFKQQSRYDVGEISLNDLKNGEAFLAEKIKKLAKSGVRIITFDCIDHSDLSLIGDAVIKAGITFITVDPGPFTGIMAEKLVKTKAQEKGRISSNKKVLAVVGSVNPVTKIQAEHFIDNKEFAAVIVKTGHFLRDDQEAKEYISRITHQILEAYENKDIVAVIGDGIYSENRMDLSQISANSGMNKDALSSVLNMGFAEIALSVLNSKAGIRGIYSSGGDITVAICEKLNAKGIELFDEVLPLAAYGKIVGGEYEGLDVVTKGGMVGEEDAMEKCVCYLRNRLEE